MSIKKTTETCRVGHYVLSLLLTATLLLTPQAATAQSVTVDEHNISFFVRTTPLAPLYCYLENSPRLGRIKGGGLELGSIWEPYGSEEIAQRISRIEQRIELLLEELVALKEAPACNIEDIRSKAAEIERARALISALAEAEPICAAMGDNQPPENEPSCGNGVVEEGEQCDDGNLTNDDGCSEQCSIELSPSPTPTPDNPEDEDPQPPTSNSGGCSDGIDNDGDGAIDSADAQCRRFPYIEYDPQALAGGSRVDGWTVYEPSADSRVIYVSSSQGSDSNSGLSPVDALRTISAAKALLRDGHPDWLLLRRGDTWYEAFGRWSKNGRSGEEPLVLASYGTNGERPTLKTGSRDGLSTCCVGDSLSHLAVIGISFHAHTRDGDHHEFVSNSGGNSAINTLTSGANLVVEDCKFDSYKNGATIQDRTFHTSSVPLSQLENVSFRRNVIVDSYASPGHSQGLFVSGIHHMLIEENVFDHNGWFGDRDTGGGIGGEATIFNHNMYVDNENSVDIVVRNNIVTRAASHGIQLRPGGALENNLFVRNPLPVLIGGGTNYQELSPDGIDGVMRLNVVLHANDITSDLPRGLGVDFVNIRSLRAENNIVAHVLSRRVNNRAFRLLGTESNPSRNAHIEGNIVYKWDRGGVEEVGTLYNNTVQDNFYWDFSTGSDNFSSEEQNWPDPERSVESYHAAIGNSATFESFIAQARSQSKFNWRDEYLASTVNDYVRAGFLGE